MERLKSRWTAGATALLLVVSLSGVAGAAALISSLPVETAGPQKSPGHAGSSAWEKKESTVEAEATDAAQRDAADRAAAGDQGRQGGDGTVGEGCESAQPEGTAPDGTAEAGTTQDHGTRVAAAARDRSLVGGPRGNHGYCVSRVARGVDAEASPGQENTQSECDTATPPTTPETGGAGQQDAPRNHGAAVSTVARSDAVAQKTDGAGQVVEGSTCNHGHAVSAVARDNHGHAQRSAGGPERAGKAGATRGEGATKVKAHGKTKLHAKRGKGRGGKP